jgi:RNA polymerase sigma-70 factor (ECF subfamily)
LTPEQERQAASLMRLAQAGDQAAYASLLVMLTSAARQFARRRVGGSAPWVDDVVQETLLTVHGARHTYDANRPFAPWFYAIASNRMIDVIRRERRVAAREVASGELPEDASHQPATERDAIDVEAIRAAVAALPPRQRAVVEGLKFRDQSVREVAGRMGMTESAVKVTAHRGYRALRRLLGAGTRED